MNTTWVGWLRLPRCRWRAVCSADNWAAAWDALLAIHPPGNCEKCVLKEGKRP